MNEKFNLIVEQLIVLESIYRRSFFIRQELYDKFSISKYEAIYLTILRNNPKNMTQISNEHGVSPQQLSRISDSLEKKELIHRYIDTENRRRIKSEITPKGLNLLEAIEHALLLKIENKLKTLSEENLDELLSSLSSINALFNKIENKI